jgi:hypothetical protein
METAGDVLANGWGAWLYIGVLADRGRGRVAWLGCSPSLGTSIGITKAQGVAQWAETRRHGKNWLARRSR